MDNPQEKLPVKVGLSTLDTTMTRAQAQRWGERNMPPALQRAGFACVVARTDREIHGGVWLRISYGAFPFPPLKSPLGLNQGRMA